MYTLFRFQGTFLIPSKRKNVRSRVEVETGYNFSIDLNLDFSGGTSDEITFGIDSLKLYQT